MNRRLISIRGAVLVLAAAAWLAAGTHAQSTIPPPVSTYLATWTVSIQPNDIAANQEDGTLAVVDAGNNAIQILRRGGSHKQFREGFRDPRCAAFLPGGILLVGEALSGSVKGYDRNGHVVLTLGAPAGEFQTPNDIAVHTGSGRIFVVDSAANAVKVYRQPTGLFEFEFGTPGSGPGELKWPVSVAVNAGLDEAYVGDSRNRRIAVFDASTGIFKRSISGAGKDDGEISYVGGIHVDGQDRIFVVESLGSFVQIFSPEGGFIGKIGEHGIAGGQLRTPKAVAIDRYNRLLVTSFLDKRIELWGLDSYENPSDVELDATADAIPAHIHPNLPTFQVVFQVPGVDPAEIDADSLRLNETVEAETDWYRTGPHLSVRFSTPAVLATYPPGTQGNVVFTLSGETTDGRWFETGIPAVIVSSPVEPDPNGGGAP